MKRTYEIERISRKRKRKKKYIKHHTKNGFVSTTGNDDTHSTQHRVSTHREKDSAKKGDYTVP